MAKPDVISIAPDTLTPVTANINGRCLSMGGLPTIVWFEYSDNWPHNKITLESHDVEYDGQTFTEGISKLLFQHLYAFQFRGYNADGYAYGGVILFWVPSILRPGLGAPWLIKSQAREWVGSDLHWQATTDICCHLFIRVGDRIPGIVKEWWIKEGRIFHPPPSLYFDWKWQYEQIEPGDTLVHTFSIPFWVACTTLWWYGYGYVDQKSSPSISPFFADHYKPPPVQEYEFNLPKTPYSKQSASSYEWDWEQGGGPTTDFVALSTHLIDKIVLQAAQYSTRWPKVGLTVRLYRADGTGYPYGDVLTEGNVPSGEIGGVDNPNIIECRVPTYEVQEGLRYAWVFFPNEHGLPQKVTGIRVGISPNYSTTQNIYKVRYPNLVQYGHIYPQILHFENWTG